MPPNRLPRVMKHYCPTGRRNLGRPLKRLLDMWDRNGSASGPNLWQTYDDDNDDDDDDEIFNLPYLLANDNKGITHCCLLHEIRVRGIFLHRVLTIIFSLTPCRLRYVTEVSNDPAALVLDEQCTWTLRVLSTMNELMGTLRVACHKILLGRRLK